MGKLKQICVEVEVHSRIRKILQESARAISCIYELTHEEPMEGCTVQNLSEEFLMILARINHEKTVPAHRRRFPLFYFPETPCPKNRPF